MALRLQEESSVQWTEGSEREAGDGDDTRTTYCSGAMRMRDYAGGRDSQSDPLTSQRRVRQLPAAVCPRAARDWRLHQWTHGSSEN